MPEEPVTEPSGLLSPGIGGNFGLIVRQASFIGEKCSTIHQQTFLSAFYVPATGLGVWDTSVNKIGKNPYPRGDLSLSNKRKNRTLFKCVE